jgi:hypothetical protein
MFSKLILCISRINFAALNYNICLLKTNSHPLVLKFSEPTAKVILAVSVLQYELSVLNMLDTTHAIKIRKIINCLSDSSFSIDLLIT